MRTITGGCHCGNIEYELVWPEAGQMIPTRACGCTFCVKHGGNYTSSPKARLDVHISATSSVNRYAFGTKTAEFFICTRCGVVPFVRSTITGVDYAVVNVNTFENVDASQLSSSPTDFEGETVEVRLERRKRNWISSVLIREDGV